MRHMSIKKIDKAIEHTRAWKEFFRYTRFILIQIAIVLIIFSLFIRVIQVLGQSMTPAFDTGDILIYTPAVKDYRRGDVIVFTDIKANVKVVKRIVAVAGDTVDIDFKTGDVIVNGNVIQEIYAYKDNTKSYDVRFPITVAKDTVFVLGDNREVSVDSRSSEIGLVPLSVIKGKVVLLISRSW